MRYINQGNPLQNASKASPSSASLIAYDASNYHGSALHQHHEQRRHTGIRHQIQLAGSRKWEGVYLDGDRSDYRFQSPGRDRRLRPEVSDARHTVFTDFSGIIGIEQN